MKRHCLTIALLAGTLGVSSCGRKATSPDVLARVGEREIRVADAEREITRRALGGLPSLGAEPLVEELVQRETLLARARALGLDREPEFVRSFENLLIGRLRERELESRLRAVDATPDEVAARVETNRVRRVCPEQRRLAVLQLDVPAKASASVRARAVQRMSEARERARQEATAGSGFGPLAVEFSDDQATRYVGGDVGWIERERARSRLAPEVVAAGFALVGPGDISDVIEGTNGVYLIKLVEARASQAEPAPVSDLAAAAARQAVLRRKRREVEAAFFDGVRRSADVEVFSAAIVRWAAVHAPDSQPDKTSLVTQFP